MQSNMQVNTYSGVDQNALKLIRVQKGVGGLKAEKGDLFLSRLNESNSVRNTVHFTLNAVVQDHAYGKLSDFAPTKQ